MNLRNSADQAGWSIREAAWGLEERVLWRGSDAAGRALEHGGETADRARRAAQQAARRAQEAIAPLQRLIQTRLTWPLADALRERGTAARAGIAATAVAAAVAAGVAGASFAPDSAPTPSPTAELGPLPAAPSAPAGEALQGTAPKIEVKERVKERGVKQALPPAPATPPPAEAPADAPDEVAWKFASAFVTYEVGKSSPQTTEVFEQTAAPPLAKSLAASPPRLPNGTKVPQARVLNVVLAERKKDEVTASVSLARLRAVSEVRLTLTHTDKHGWRVVQVLG
jgi:hypothetical protein